MNEIQDRLKADKIQAQLVSKSKLELSNRSNTIMCYVPRDICEWVADQARINDVSISKYVGVILKIAKERSDGGNEE